MRKPDLNLMDFEELWLLHEELTKILAEKITAEKLELEKRLAQLNRVEKIGQSAHGEAGGARTPRRKYPKVLPKYRNPLVPTEKWSGRGKQPRWLVSALKSGHKLEEFSISENDRLTAGKSPSRTRQS
ncbi:H-NS family nucleoid-associated regulatory protein [Rhodoblastus sp.]|uniref:H-NS histone family protein n=1 Tax=Rhodoblastus sp. TaxID=1962975 RepID=UPI0035AEB914